MSCWWTAEYSFTGTLTSPKLIEPDQIARAMRRTYPGDGPPTHCWSTASMAAQLGERPGGWPHAGLRLSGSGGTCQAEDATRTTRSTDDHTSYGGRFPPSSRRAIVLCTAPLLSKPPWKAGTTAAGIPMAVGCGAAT